MVRLAESISDTLIHEYGTEEFLHRLSDPYRFQAFSCVLGFDWHSSGTMTTACGALKLAIKPAKHGIAIAGGNGKVSRNALSEIENAARFFSFSSGEIEMVQQGVNQSYAHRYHWVSDKVKNFVEEPHSGYLL